MITNKELLAAVNDLYGRITKLKDRLEDLEGPTAPVTTKGEDEEATKEQYLCYICRKPFGAVPWDHYTLGSTVSCPHCDNTMRPSTAKERYKTAIQQAGNKVHAYAELETKVWELWHDMKSYRKKYPQ